MMLRRCVRELLCGRCIRRNRIGAQMPFFLASRNEFSSAAQQQKTPSEKPPSENSQSGNSVSKLFLGSVVVGAAVIAAYHSGYFGQYRSKDGKSSFLYNKIDNVKTLEEDRSVNQVVLPNNGKTDTLAPSMETSEKNDEPRQLKDSEVYKGSVSETKEEEPLPVKENELASLPNETTPPSAEQSFDSKVLSEDSLNMDSNVDQVKLSREEKEATQTSVVQSKERNGTLHVSEEAGVQAAGPHQDTSMEMPKGSPGSESELQNSLAYSYSLKEAEGSPAVSGKEEGMNVSATMFKNKEVSSGSSKGSLDKSGSEDGKILLDLIEAIHAAERKQAESDAYIFAEEKRKLKEKYEKELKDARARELMYAEEAAILDKELNKEKVKAAATIKLLHEKAEQKLLEELKRKEEDADKELKKVKELSKAELAAAIAKEKSSQIEKIAEANLHINALCMAFYARSEEARQSHSVHKLALGTLALEDALSKGLPIWAEVDALCMSLEGIDRDSLLGLALSSLPEESLIYGTNTQMQLSQKFDSLKGILRHFSLIPAGGGGILAHTVAHVASSIKMREDQFGDSIESLISRVENFIVEGRLTEAADALEAGVLGTEAAEVIGEWVRQARNRAITEQALSLLQSYATSITFA